MGYSENIPDKINTFFNFEKIRVTGYTLGLNLVFHWAERCNLDGYTGLHWVTLKKLLKKVIVY